MFETILLLSPLAEGSGNRTTILRIKDHLDRHGFKCICKSPQEFTSASDCARYTKRSHTSLVIGIHAYKAGRLLKDIDVPFVIILGGTDVNQMSNEQDKLIVMNNVLKKASYVVAFNSSLMKFHHKWPFFDSSRCSIIPQAVSVYPSSFCVRSYIRVNYTSTICDDFTRLFVMVGGIRPVKNPLFIMRQFAEWQRHCCSAFRSLLVIIGPVVDEKYFLQFKMELDKHPEIVFIPGLPIEDCHAAIRDSFCLVNSSDSEGMAISILEAMAQGTPVLVRHNQGNCSIVQDRKTGLVFHTQEDFVEKANELMKDKDLYKILTQNALEYVDRNHSLKFEENAYLNIVRKVKDMV